MSAGLDGASFVVTGGSMGIGRACAAELLRAGGRVLIAARGAAALRDAESALGREHGAERVAAFSADVTEGDSVGALFDAAETRFGTVRGVVHAAAVVGPIGTVLEIDPQEWWDAVRVDLFGALLVAREAAARMRERGGSLVLFSGGGGTTPFPRYSAYASSKAAVVRLAETLALELAPFAIRVNALAPGFVATRMHDATLAAGVRAGESYLERTRSELESGGVPPELAARAAAFLLSDESAGITGRLLAAPWDDWQSWGERTKEIQESDLFTLRRIVPADRGLSWR